MAKLTVPKSNKGPNIPNGVRDSRGLYLTRALFRETIPHHSRYKPPYTLGEADRPWGETEDRKEVICRSAKDMYLEIADPTEYKFAMALLGSWDHWQHLLTLPWFQPIIEEWREELKIKLRSEAIEKLKDMADGYDPAALSAAKQLLQLHTDKTKKAVGRPRKPVGDDKPSVSEEDLDRDYKRVIGELKLSEDEEEAMGTDTTTDYGA